MSMKGSGTLEGALAGGKLGGGWGALIGGALGMMQGDKQQGSDAVSVAQDAYAKGRQQMADMRNGIELDDNDRSGVINSLKGYGTYGSY